MVKQVIDIGAEPNDGTGDPLRDAFIKTNQNFTELYNSDKASYDTANAAYAVANAAGGFTIGGIYTQANTAYFVANAAFDRANSVGGAGIAAAFGAANASYATANAAFAVANNSGTANLAFDRANIAINNVNYVNVKTQAAFVQANLAFDNSNTALNLAQIARDQAIIAITRANAAFNGVGAAFDTANISLARANSASNTANATQNTAVFAYRTANAAFDFANTITGGGGGGGGIIGDSSNIAIAAFIAANAAFDQANTGGGGGNGANAFANTTGTFEGDLTVKGNTIFLRDIYVNPSIRENVACTTANTLVVHGTTFGFGTDAPQSYDGWTVITIGGIDNAFPYGSPVSGRHGDVIWLSANGNYIADFYAYDAGSGTDAFKQYYQSNVEFQLASSSYQFNFQGETLFSNRTFFYGLNGIKRFDPVYELDVVGTINASAVLVNGLPISAGGPAFNGANAAFNAANAAFNQANTANLLAFRANVNAAAAFAQANAAYAFANTANVLAFRANVNAAAAFAQANIAVANVNFVNTAMQAAFNVANIAIANVNFVNAEASAAFSAANLALDLANNAYARANLLLASGNTQPLAAEANSFWFNTDTAELFINYRDWDGTLQWVQINGSYGSGPKELRDINYYVMFYSPGLLDSNVTMYLNKAPTRYYLPAGLTGSFAISDGVPTGTTANLRILKNESYIGNIAFAQGSSNGTFVFPSQVSFDQGDVLRIRSPAGSVDPTFSDVSITITGVKITP